MIKGDNVFCDFCNAELTHENKGKVVRFMTGSILKPVTRTEHVCNTCYEEPDYQEIVKTGKAIVKDYPGIYD